MATISRAAILPFPGDPFLLHYWLELYNKHWAYQINKLYIYFNSPIEKECVDYVHKLCTKYPNINYTYNPLQIDHGDAINRTLDLVTEDFVMLVEDDGFIFNGLFVDRCFHALETGQYDIVGSKRGSCHTEILKAAMVKWGLSYEGFGDQGPNFWPNFLFIKTEWLRKTDRNFCGKAWTKGQTIEALDHVVQNDVVYSDTFVNTSLQLRTMTTEDRILYVPQYHGHPDDYDHYTAHSNLFDGNAPWCHIGSLSSGVGGILTDEQGRSLTRRLLDPPRGSDKLPSYCNSEFEQREFERRVQWWLTFWENREPNEIPAFADLYKQAIDRIIVQYKLSLKRIKQRQAIYHTIGL